MDKYIKYEDILECRSFQDEEGRWILHAEIDEIPAADVAPVRHGRWEKVTSLMHQFGYYLGASCSICGKTHYFLSGEMILNYCPNCGAKMDLDGDGE